MKIALFTYEFFPKYGGISHTVTSLCKTFRGKKHQLHVFNPFYQGNNIYNILDKKEYRLKDIFLILKNKRFLEYLRLSVMKIIKHKKAPFNDRLKMIFFLLIPKYCIKFTRNLSKVYPYFKKINFDIVFGSATGGFTLPLVFVLSKIFKIKAISLSHGDDFLQKKKVSFRASYIKNLDKIILSNNKMKELFKEIYKSNEDKLTIINRGIIPRDYEIKDSKQELRKEFNINENDFVLISVGNHVPRKGFDIVIKAINLIVKNYSDISIKYFLIGDGPFTPKLKEITKELNLNRFVNFTGEINHELRNKYYKLSDVFLMPSLAQKNSIEGFGIAFLEANYFKLPVIGTKTGGIVEAIIDGKNGLLTKPNDITDIKKKLLFLYRNKRIREKMGLEGHKRVINEFNWDKIYNDYIITFEKLIKLYKKKETKFY